MVKFKTEMIEWIHIQDIIYDKKIEHQNNRLIKLMSNYTLISSINKIFETNQI